jgi:transposase InsO family protein
MRTRRSSYLEPNDRPRGSTPKRNQVRAQVQPEEIPRRNGASFNQNLNEIYHNVKSIPNYSSKIKDFLRTNITSSLHRQVRKKFPRRRIIVHFPFQIIMSDLIDYSHAPLPFHNSGFRYIMVCIDCFSKFAWAEPLKRKDGLSSTMAIEKILDRMKEIPQSFVTDRGLEYYDHRVQKLFKRFGIKHYSITGTHKAAIAERFIRTIKGRFEKYFWTKKKPKWHDVLQDFIANYNKTYHRSIKMAPNEVNENNRDQVYKTLFPKEEQHSTPRLRKGDRVRIIKEKNIFEKGYKRSWSLELYTIREAISTNGVDYYKIEDLQGNSIPRHRYYWELNFVSRNDN